MCNGGSRRDVSLHSQGCCEYLSPLFLLHTCRCSPVCMYCVQENNPASPYPYIWGKPVPLHLGGEDSPSQFRKQLPKVLENEGVSDTPNPKRRGMGLQAKKLTRGTQSGPTVHRSSSIFGRLLHVLAPRWEQVHFAPLCGFPRNAATKNACNILKSFHGISRKTIQHEDYPKRRLDFHEQEEEGESTPEKKEITWYSPESSPLGTVM